MIICIAPNCSINCSDWIIFGLGIIVSIGWALFIFSLRPKIKIDIPSLAELDIKGKNKRCINIPIRNLSCFSKATKISLEVALIEGNQTYHLKTDFQDFSFIPKKRKKNDPKRTFTAYDSTDFLKQFYEINFDYLIEKLNDSNVRLRVRLHATHSFSGLGKTEEELFYFSESKNMFIIQN